MKSRIIIMVFILIAVTGHTHTQTGYLGALNSIELKMSIVPTNKRFNKIVEVGDESQLHSKLRYGMPSYQLNYARTVSRRIELAAGLEFAAMNLIAESVRFSNGTSYTMLENLKSNRIGSNFQFKFYRKGCFSPIGKFIGFSINMGKARVNTNEGLIYGTTGSSITGGTLFSRSNFFSRKRSISSQFTTFDLVDKESSFFALRASMGRNYPVGYGLTLNISVSAPILSYYYDGFGGDMGFRMWDSGAVRINNGDLEDSLRMTLHKYNRVLFSFSIKKYF